MRLFNVYDFSKDVRLLVLADSKGRCDFDPPILKDDIICGAACIYIERKINVNDKVIDILRDISEKLHEELDTKQQIHNYFRNCDYSFLPFSISCDTLGVSLSQKHYDGLFSFDVIEQNLFPLTSLYQGISKKLFYVFTVNDVGCYLNIPFTYPHFHDEEMEDYLKNIARLMKIISDKDNSNITIEDLVRIKKKLINNSQQSIYLFDFHSNHEESKNYEINKIYFIINNYHNNKYTQ